jgi:hypothetical protein
MTPEELEELFRQLAEALATVPGGSEGFVPSDPKESSWMLVAYGKPWEKRTLYVDGNPVE